MSSQFANDCLGNAAEEKNGSRHVPQVMNPEILDPRAGAGSLEGLPNVPEMQLLTRKAHVAPVGWEKVFVTSKTWQPPQGSNTLLGEREALGAPVLGSRHVNVRRIAIQVNFGPLAPQ